MSEFDEQGWTMPETRYVSTRRPRISGTALVGGLHLATGNYGTAPAWQLFISGLGIVAALAIAMVLTYVELFLLDSAVGTSFSLSLLGPAEASAVGTMLYVNMALQLLPMANFLVVLRLSPLSGYHAAEHKVVGAIEAFGGVREEQVVEMPRAHPRCGTVLLFGIIPALLIAFPLWSTNPIAAMLVAFVGWSLRYRVGYFIQQYFTTKPPTPAQLRAGMDAGAKILRLWASNPDRDVSIAQGLWTRGLPQMIGGVMAGQYLLGLVYEHLHVWLDF
ncbi:MAG: DUF1385 domain-containing protein [Armatimonadota bacterium]